RPALDSRQYPTFLNRKCSASCLFLYVISGVGNLQQASNYLSQAQWIVLRTPDCSGAFQHRLHRSLGLLCAAGGNFDQALYHLANDIYLASSTFGVKSVEASGGYFHMANVFFHQNKMDIANSLYAEVGKSKTHPLSISQLTFFFSCVLFQYYFILDAAEAQQAEAIQVLNAVLDIREKAPKQQPGETARVLHALAMLYYLIMDLSKMAGNALQQEELGLVISSVCTTGS
uniref:Zinc finger MYND-type containing 12 n=1 Tax=Meleagris gallopavo TaxID=9103 RepID=A0A803YFK4_MELGA